jgi:uncharacterized membrane protein YhdT
MAGMRVQIILGKIFSRETLWALILSLLILAVFIFTADSAPQWIYQGF